MKIVLIGSGNVATILAEKFVKGGCSILQVVSQNETHAKQLADHYHASFADFNGVLNTQGDIYIIALTDKGLQEYASAVKIPGKLVLHTTGSVSINVLKGMTETYGVMYPLQSLKNGVTPPLKIPLLIDGSDSLVLQKIKAIAHIISNDVQELKDEERFKMHLAAVMVNNFSNYLFAMVERYCVTENLNFDLLKPLLMETAGRINHYSPGLVQTGPAIRKDMDTINMHLELLNEHPELKDLYRFLSDKILENFNK